MSSFIDYILFYKYAVKAGGRFERANEVASQFVYMKGGAGILHTRGIFTSCPRGESRIRFILYEQWALLLSEVLYCASEKPGRIFVLWDSHGYENETVK
jgi:hypothetical protein